MKGKGEGSRGGKVFGHTKSGKAIYKRPVQNEDHDDYGDFDAQDHRDAHKLHSKEGGNANQANRHKMMAEAIDHHNSFKVGDKVQTDRGKAAIITKKEKDVRIHHLKYEDGKEDLLNSGYLKKV